MPPSLAVLQLVEGRLLQISGDEDGADVAEISSIAQGAVECARHTLSDITGNLEEIERAIHAEVAP